jgi:hypothetical protein
MRKRIVAFALAACVLSFMAADGAATGPATLVVDDDRAQCSNADFASIQEAVVAADPGAQIQICPGLYAESVAVAKPLRLHADPDAVTAVDCFQPTLSELPREQLAIVDPVGCANSVSSGSSGLGQVR